MKMKDARLLQSIEDLIVKMQALEEQTTDPDKREGVEYTLRALVALTDAVLQENPVFGIEPWHPITDDVPLSQPGEMLLRLKDRKGAPIAPYPAIMTFYQNGLTAEIDTVLFLCALNQFQQSDEKQVSINVSAMSLRDADFIKIIHERLEGMSLAEDEKIIMEIHESATLKMSQKALRLFRDVGLGFAIDDVGLNMNDVLRISEFENIADFIKIDRQSVIAKPESKNSLDNVVSFISSMLPETVLVAEGVRDAEHAAQLHEFHPDIKYVQGLYLLPRDEFAQQYRALKK